MGYRFVLAVALAGLSVTALASAAMAQADHLPSSAAPSCELDVWASWTVGADIHGMTSGGLLFQKQNATHGRIVGNALDVPVQLGVLTAGDLPARLGIPPATVVQHEHPAETAGELGKLRQSGTTLACYYELHVTNITAFKSFLFDELRVSYVLVDFTQSPKPRRFVRVTSGPLKLFPAAPGEDLLAVNDEIIAAFKVSLDKFAAASREMTGKAAAKQ